MSVEYNPTLAMALLKAIDWEPPACPKLAPRWNGLGVRDDDYRPPNCMESCPLPRKEDPHAD